ncbi:short-chain dehydrogenase [Caballeronia mineralivorans PML1(12)]|uniref:Short-chain dehydrogenase n=1 Tax=Caballeronia mineralivorans PML1(12) TaxID=908627 RepID=A0A0J1FYC9_9BURK|nr:SDR family NAD(P)-dependent oxidoreductase [Caballeronia mineralivorans]KLU24958.1 short-chain dehydrogenase [Caballeronia mineralivorans PML1(12)]
MLLQDKVCVIVGAASLRGIGYAVAELFAEHGAKIIAVDILMNDIITSEIKASIDSKTGRNAYVSGIRCDIANSADCRQLFKEALSRYGTVDCLVNSAAIVKAQSMLTIEEADYDRIMGVNLKGAFNLCKSALEVFAERKSGTIVNVASVAAQRGGGLVGGAHYAASKGGVISLTRTIAREFGPLGIRANVVCPSMTETGMLDGMTAERQKEIEMSIPLQRAGRPVEIAGACLFLASDLSGYVTGATIDVNGGSHIH